MSRSDPATPPALETVAKIEYGTRVTKKRDAGTQFPVYGGGGATFAIDRFNRTDCFIVSRFGISERCVRYVSGRFFLNDSGLTVTTKDSSSLYQRYLDYFLLSKQPEIYELGRGTAQKNLNIENFKRLGIEIPPLVQQKRIVSVLDQAFAFLDRACVNVEANLSDADALLAETRESLLDAKQAGWRVRPLSDLITIKHGFAFKSEYFVEDGELVLLTPGNFFESGGYRDRGEKQKYYSGDVPSGYLLDQGDLLMAMTEQAPGLLGSCILGSGLIDRARR